MPETGLFEQVRATMLVTVFVFLGIEGASVYSRYAKKRSDVGTATIMGFIGVTALMVLVTLLPYAVLPRAEIAGMRQPSMAGGARGGGRPLGRGVHQHRRARLGAGRLSRLVADLRRGAVRRRRKSKDMPKLFATENQNKVPAAALWLTNIVVQLFVISTYWSQGCLRADAQPDQRDVADPLSCWSRLMASCSPGAARPMRCRPQERSRDLIIRRHRRRSTRSS